MTKRNKQGGYTLIELIVSIAILSLIAVPMMSVFVSSIRINQRTYRTVESKVKAERIMEELKTVPFVDFDKILENYGVLVVDESDDYEKVVENGTERIEITVTPIDSYKIEALSVFDPVEDTTSPLLESVGDTASRILQYPIFTVEKQEIRIGSEDLSSVDGIHSFSALGSPYNPDDPQSLHMVFLIDEHTADNIVIYNELPYDALTGSQKTIKIYFLNAVLNGTPSKVEKYITSAKLPAVSVGQGKVVVYDYTLDIDDINKIQTESTYQTAFIIRVTIQNDLDEITLQGVKIVE